MFVVTGAVRGQDDLARISSHPIVSSMSKTDFLISIGGCYATRPRIDFRDALEELRELPCSLLILDGERDDHDLLADHPAYPWNGGLAQLMSRGIMRLCRGQVFDLGGVSVLTMGGASTEGREDIGKYWNWWPEQDPSREDVLTALGNAAGKRLDYVLTCDCPSSWKPLVGKSSCPSSDALEDLRKEVDYGCWLFSHNGPDREFPDQKARCIDRDVVPLR